MDVSPERKAKVEMLDQMSEFDPINDYDSNYGRVLGVKVPLPSPTLGGGRGLLQPFMSSRRAFWRVAMVSDGVQGYPT